MDEYEIVVRFRATHDNERAEDTATFTTAM
jgi:hypothetical protein